MRDIEKYTSDYHNDYFERFQVKYRRKKVLELLYSYPHKNIIEVGCGEDPLFTHMEDDAYDTMTIVEPSHEFCEIAKGKVRSVNKVMVYEMPLERFASEGGQSLEFSDYIVASSLLHEVEDPSLLLQSVRKLCTDKTTVHINVPNMNSFHRILAEKAGLINERHEKSDRNVLFQQHTNFDITTLEDIVTKNGFEVVESGSYFIKPFTHEQMGRMLTGNIISEQVLDGLYEMTTLMPDLGSEIYVQCKLK